MALPEIRIRATADTGAATAGVNKLTGSVVQLDGAQKRLAATSAVVQRSSGNMTRGIQNAAFQMQDFAVMTGMGVSASRALALQLPQLLGGFGVLGAVLGAVVAIGFPVAEALRRQAEAGADLSGLLGVLNPLVERLGDAFRFVAEVSIVAAEAVINNLDRIIITAGALAAFFAGRWVVSFAAARLATLTLAGALATLRAALIRLGFGAIIIAAGELIYQFTRLVQAAGSFGEALAVLRAIGVEVWDRIKLAATGALWIMEGSFKKMAAAGIEAFASVIETGVNFAERITDIAVGAKNAFVAAWSVLPAALGDFMYQAANSVVQAVESMINAVISRVNSFVSGLNSVLSGLPEWAGGGGRINVPSLSSVDFGDVGNPFAGAAAGMADTATAAFEAAQGMSDFADGTERMRGAAQTLGDTGSADVAAGRVTTRLAGDPIESVQRMRDLLASIKDDRITLPDLLGVGAGDDEGGAGGGGGSPALKKLDEELSAQEDRIREHFNRIKALTEGGLSDKLGAWGSYFDNLISLTGTKNDRLLAIGKTFAAAQALIDAWSAHNQVLRDPTLPWFAKIASAASVFAAGLGAVRAIGAIGGGGGGGGGVGAGAGAAATAAPTQTIERVATIQVAGQMSLDAEMMAQVINEMRADGYQIGNVVRV